MIRASQPKMWLGHTGDELATAQAYRDVAHFVPRLGAMIDAVHRHHLVGTRTFIEGVVTGPSASLLCGVGFADLSGFTALTQLLTPAELSTMLTEFDATASDVVHADGGRLVKFLGDAVMWVSSDPERLAKAALDLVDHPRAREAGIQVRAGLAYGPILAINGDYFGNAVNLAARLVAAAEPGQILAAAEVHEKLPDWPATVRNRCSSRASTNLSWPMTCTVVCVVRVNACEHTTRLPRPCRRRHYLAAAPQRRIGGVDVPVVSSGDEDQPGAVVASAESLLPAEAVAEIEAGLRALTATGASEQVHRLVVSSLPVASVLTIGLGKPRDEWPADVIRRAAGAAARALGGAEAVITTLAELPGAGVLAAAVEGLILGSYRFTEFRTDKTAPKDPGLRKITVLSTAKDAKAQAAHAAAVATAVATARDLVNTPPSHLFQLNLQSGQRLWANQLVSGRGARR